MNTRTRLAALLLCACGVTVAQAGPGHFRLQCGEQVHELQDLADDGEDARFVLDGVMDRVSWVREGPRLWLHLDGRAHEVDDRTHEPAARREAAGGDGRVRASMNGRVVAVQAAVGDRVAAGQPLLSLEAMKMEHVHAAPRAGVVRQVHARVGDQGAAQRLLVEIEPDAERA